MSLTELKNSLRKQLSGDFEKDKNFLSEKSAEYTKENNRDGMDAVTDLLVEIMPEKYRNELMDVMYIDGIRLDKVYREIVKLINLKQFEEAMPKAEKLYEKIIKGFKEDENTKFVSLRNSFEDNLYQILFKPQKTLNRAPFDLARMISAYGYLLVEYKKLDEAEEVLKKASEYNPVDCDPQFELSEVYKFQKKKDKILEITRDILHVASSPSAIARCYSNLGYMCVDLKEYDDAVVFYYTSMLAFPNPAINSELRNIVQITNQRLVPPDKDRINSTFKKYDVTYGANKSVVELAAQLAHNCISNNDFKNALIYLKILYGLTNDPKIKEIILKYEPERKNDSNSNKDSE